jgi:hypothetical protein
VTRSLDGSGGTHSCHQQAWAHAVEAIRDLKAQMGGGAAMSDFRFVFVS